MVDIVDILFTIAAFGFTLSAIPQIIKLYKTKTANDVSLTRNQMIWSMLSITILGCIIGNLLFSIIMNTIQIILVTIMIFQIKRYRK